MTTFLGVTLAISLGPASVLDATVRPAVYEESIAWGAAFSLLSIYCFVRWWSHGGRGWALTLVLSLVLGANARPTVLPLAMILGAASSSAPQVGAGRACPR